MHFFLDYQAIFFDFDGLLVNTEHLHYQAYEKMMLENGSCFPWDFQTFTAFAHKSSTGLYEKISEYAPNLVETKGWKNLYAQKKQCYQGLLQLASLELMPGVSQMLYLIEEANIPCCVVTNSTKEQVSLIKEKLPILEALPCWVVREDYDEPKPSPDGYLKAIQQLSLSPKGKMIGFEDTLRGIYSLQRAQIDPVLICCKNHPQMEDIARGSCPHFTSFLSLLK